MFITTVEDIFNQIVNQHPDYKNITNDDLNIFMLQILKDILKNIYRGPNNLLIVDNEHSWYFDCICTKIKKCRICVEDDIIYNGFVNYNSKKYYNYNFHIFDEVIIRYKSIENMGIKVDLDKFSDILNNLMESILVVSGLISSNKYIEIILTDIEENSNGIIKKIEYFIPDTLSNLTFKNILNGQIYKYNNLLLSNEYKYMINSKSNNYLYKYSIVHLNNGIPIYSYVETKIPNIRTILPEYDWYGCHSSQFYVNIFDNCIPGFIIDSGGFNSRRLYDGVLSTNFDRDIYNKYFGYYRYKDLALAELFYRIDTIYNVIYLRYVKKFPLDNIFDRVLNNLYFKNPSYAYQFSSINIYPNGPDYYSVDDDNYYDIIDYDEDKYVIYKEDILKSYIINQHAYTSNEFNSIKNINASHQSDLKFIKNEIDNLKNDFTNHEKSINDIKSYFIKFDTKTDLIKYKQDLVKCQQDLIRCKQNIRILEEKLYIKNKPTELYWLILILILIFKCWVPTIPIVIILTVLIIIHSIYKNI